MDNVLKKLLESLDIVEREQRKLIDEEEFCKNVTLDNGLVIKLESDANRVEKLSYGFYYVMKPISDAIAMILRIEISDDFTDTILANELTIEARIKRLKLLK